MPGAPPAKTDVFSTSPAQGRGDIGTVAKEQTAQGQAIVTTIEKGKQLLELVYADQPTRNMLEKFAEDYYPSETPIMISQQGGEIASGLIPGILVALVLGSPELVPTRGLEPPRGCPHHPLKMACLPIPPRRQDAVNARKE